MKSRFARLLFVFGATVGVVGIGAVMLGLHTRVPPWVLEVSLIKLIVLAAAGFMGAGAVLERGVRRESSMAARPAEIVAAGPDAAPIPRKDEAGIPSARE